MPEFKSRTCVRCGAIYIPTSGPQKYCSTCRHVANREKMGQYGRLHASEKHGYNAQYRLENGDELRKKAAEFRHEHLDLIHRQQKLSRQKNIDAVRANTVKWRKEHPDEVRQYSLRYYREHSDEIRERDIQYRQTHKEQCRAQSRENYRKNRQRILAHASQYAREHPEVREQWEREHPELYHAIRRKAQSKRRVLGFIPLNAPFIGCEGHHVDRLHVAYIPRALHRSIGHDVWTGRGMDKINALAYEWLAKEEQCQL